MKKREKIFSGKFSGVFELRGGEKDGKSSKIFGKNCAAESKGGRRQCRVRADYAGGVGGVIEGTRRIARSFGDKKLFQSEEKKKKYSHLRSENLRCSEIEKEKKPN